MTFPPPQHLTPSTWTKVSSKRGRSSSDDPVRETKQVKESKHWLHPVPTTTSNRFSPLLSTTSIDTDLPLDSPRTPKPPPIYIQDVTAISPLLLLLDQIALNQYETKSLANNQVKVQPANIDSYRTITKALTDRHTAFHTYNPKEDRSYRVVLRNMHYSIPTDEIKTETEKLGHQVTNICNMTHYHTKLPLSMFFVDLKQTPNNKDIFSS
jgi:hypothetical protein